MRFKTEVIIPKYPFQLSHSRRGLILGSCFAEEIGQRMSRAKFPLLLNPHGVLFNPVSIGKAYQSIVEQRQYKEAELVESGGLWHSMQHHGSFSAATSGKALSNINRPRPSDFDYLMVTLGSAWIYKYRGEVVANCHKIDPSEFQRYRLSVTEIVDALQPLAESGMDIVVTISPVRHIKDGLSENSLSKAILRVAVAELEKQYPNLHYFPSYEIMLDELRDYRFYARDMLHISEVAVEYIWYRFSEAFFSQETQHVNDQIAKINSAISHRPLHPNSEEYQKFRISTLQFINDLANKYPSIDLSSERDHFTDKDC